MFVDRALLLFRNLRAPLDVSSAFLVIFQVNGEQQAQHPPIEAVLTITAAEGKFNKLWVVGTVISHGVYKETGLMEIGSFRAAAVAKRCG